MFLSRKELRKRRLAKFYNLLEVAASAVLFDAFLLLLLFLALR